MAIFGTEDPTIRARLDRRAPSGGHGHGTGFSGVAEFPATLGEEEVMARLDAALDDPTIGYECGTSVLHLREEIDGHTCVLLRRFDEDEMWEIVTAFPLPGDPGVVINPPPAEPYPACQVASAMIGFVASLPGFGRDEPGHARLWVAATLAEVGEPYEAAIWALEMCVEHDVAFPEELYATLLAMANYEYFDATYTGAPFSKLVAAEWRRHHPATWQ